MLMSHTQVWFSIEILFGSRSGGGPLSLLSRREALLQISAVASASRRVQVPALLHACPHESDCPLPYWNANFINL